VLCPDCDNDCKTSRLSPQVFARRALTVRKVRALSDLDDIAIRIAHVAANLAVFGDWLGDELGSSTSPQLIARVNIRNAEIHKAVDVVRVGDAERYRRLIGRGPPPTFRIIQIFAS
jgi:hypothetical protein